MGRRISSGSKFQLGMQHSTVLYLSETPTATPVLGRVLSRLLRRPIILLGRQTYCLFFVRSFIVPLATPQNPIVNPSHIANTKSTKTIINNPVLPLSVNFNKHAPSPAKNNLPGATINSVSLQLLFALSLLFYSSLVEYLIL